MLVAPFPLSGATAAQSVALDLAAIAQDAGLRVFKIGGAHLAAELDAKRAIDQASRLAAAIEEASPEKVGEYVAPLGAAGWLFQKVTTMRA